MDTRTTQFDAVEHYRAAAQPDQIMLTNRNRGWAAYRDVMVEWHRAAVSTARVESAIPCGPRDPVIEEATIRFYPYQVRLTVERLIKKTEELPSLSRDGSGGVSARVLPMVKWLDDDLISTAVLMFGLAAVVSLALSI
jgi:hypothetical protein